MTKIVDHGITRDRFDEFQGSNRSLHPRHLNERLIEDDDGHIRTMSLGDLMRERGNGHVPWRNWIRSKARTLPPGRKRVLLMFLCLGTAAATADALAVSEGYVHTQLRLVADHLRHAALAKGLPPDWQRLAGRDKAAWSIDRITSRLAVLDACAHCDRIRIQDKRRNQRHAKRNAARQARLDHHEDKQA